MVGAEAKAEGHARDGHARQETDQDDKSCFKPGFHF
jgi:hypothetical protein